MKVLILGASGQLGLSLQQIQWSPDIALLCPSKSELDLSQPGEIHKYLLDAKPEVVINAAAWTDVKGAESNTKLAVDLNGTAAGYLADACKEIGSLLIHISTDYVFDGERELPYLESDPVGPLNEYGKSKLAGENLIINSGLKDYYIVRTSWLYSQFRNNFVKTIVGMSLAGTEAKIADDQFGSPTFAGDLASGIQSLLQVRPDSGIYHFSNSGVTNWFEFGKKIYDFAGGNASLVSPRKTGSDELSRPKFSQLDLSKWNSSGLNVIPGWEESLSAHIHAIVDSVKEEKN